MVENFHLQETDRKEVGECLQFWFPVLCYVQEEDPPEWQSPIEFNNSCTVTIAVVFKSQPFQY